MAGLGLVIVSLLFTFGRFVPLKTTPNVAPAMAAAGMTTPSISIDTIMQLAVSQLNEKQKKRFSVLLGKSRESAPTAQQLAVYHDLAHFWKDEAGLFEPYAWYEAEAARLENSEKSLTFAARLFLDNLQADDNGDRRQWKALQAKDLYERSLKINPDNDSARVGLGACYLFGNISQNPMEGIAKIREVINKDSTNIYAQLMLVRGSLLSGQYEKGISRLNTVLRLQPDNTEAALLMADLYERTGNKPLAIEWYERCIQLVEAPAIRDAIRDRIKELKK